MDVIILIDHDLTLSRPCPKEVDCMALDYD